MKAPFVVEAPLIGGFADSDFLEVVHHHHPLGQWHALETADAFVPAVVERGRLVFAGHEDLVDYRSTAGTGAADLLGRLLEDRPDLRLDVDSLPAEASSVVEDAALRAGRTPKRVEHVTTARLALGGDFEAYLAALSKKERHELRRKRRRYEEEMGQATIRRESSPGPLLGQFVALHRLAEGEKGEFMTDTMAAFFADVLSLEGWHVDALVDRHGTATAAVFSFEDETAYYLYNSSYDPHLRHLSPGIVLLGALIERTANSSRTTFDFLKGDETYKYRLGAESRQLYRVTA